MHYSYVFAKRLKGKAAYILAVNRYRAASLGELIKPRQKVAEGSFSTARRTYERKLLTRGDFEVYAVYNLLTVKVGEAYVIKFYITANLRKLTRPRGFCLRLLVHYLDKALKARNAVLELLHKADKHIYGIYKEVVSGDSLYARPQMLRLLEDSEGEKFGAVLVMDIDRLGRGATSEQGIILETFKYHGIKIITPRKVYDLNNELDEEYAEFETFMARRELKSIKRRLHNGTLKSVQEGCYLVNAPYGYKNCKVNKKSTLEIYEDEAKFVRMVFDLYANSGMGTQSIAYTINAMGAKPHRAEQFNRTSIAAMLRNPVYIGKVVWNKKHTLNRGVMGKKMTTVYHDKSEWMVIDGLHPPIVDAETFNRANEILSSRYHKPYNDGTIVNPLGGILKCQECGYGMQRRPYGNRKYQSDHLLCATKGCCASSRLDYVEDAVLKNIEDKLAELKSNRNAHKPAVNYEPILSGIDKEIVTINQQKENLHNLLEQGVYTVEIFTERYNKLTARLSELKMERADVTAKQEAQSAEDIELIIAKIENVLRLYHSSEPPQKNKLLKSILSSGTYYKAKGWKPTQFIISLNYIGL